MGKLARTQAAAIIMASTVRCILTAAPEQFSLDGFPEAIKWLKYTVPDQNMLSKKSLNLNRIQTITAKQFWMFSW